MEAGSTGNEGVWQVYMDPQRPVPGGYEWGPVPREYWERGMAMDGFLLTYAVREAAEGAREAVRAVAAAAAAADGVEGVRPDWRRERDGTREAPVAGGGCVACVPGRAKETAGADCARDAV